MQIMQSKLVKAVRAHRIGLVALFATTMVLMMSGIAFANFGPHGGFGPDTDACAGCHRAHTAVSGIEVEWMNESGVKETKNALLIGTTSSSMEAFCYTCHGESGAGAATNVESGTYEADKVDADLPGYGTSESEPFGVLNGGGFMEMGGKSVTSTHIVNGGTWVAWGGVDTEDVGGTRVKMDCASCHDPHGSSNYRLLKDEVNGVMVGGYGDLDENGKPKGIDSDPNPTPRPFVVSNEVGYPTTGFKLHEMPAGYKPDYTSARYAKPVGNDPEKGMSGWCAACHTYYNTTTSTGQTAAYDSKDGYGAIARHRHPVNVPLSAFHGDRSLIVGNVNGLNTAWGDNVDLPLEHNAEGKGKTQVNEASDFIGCLTCHRAHGTEKVMKGYAASPSALKPRMVDDEGKILVGAAHAPAFQGTSALLRADNRGVCERCHNK